MNYLLFFLLVTVTICQDEYGCEDCECPDLLDKLFYPFRSEVLYTEEAGCVRNLTCKTDVSTFVRFNFTDSEIPRPDDSYYDAYALTSESPEVPTGPNINIFQFFGMICENNEWYITKYPSGIFYGTFSGEESVIGANGELDGKKAKIFGIHCEPPSQ
ncbi:hypothetical protein GCK72_015763 [Caenorhabditis remanei]|uniref:DUF281 domain-containing protein n=1 Tax=Caenorhabditis remanei TaxID=31234 RepID=A0A6A5GXH2_CAERE|nr:hypothetical protein GCK72_015763 [Caenorhabditis remanei]KAF1759299.1 hypothetical protein GCK72_015763 [Caenorhabditis remanei]